MRDLLLTALVFGSLPLILYRPHFGALMWVWVGMMNPQTQVYGFAARLQFGTIVAGTTIVSLIATRKRYPFPVTSITVLLVLLFLWMSFTTMFALNTPDEVNELWVKVFKVQLMLWITLMLIDGRKQIEQLIWAIVISIGFYGVKGGIWTVLTAGAHRVWGPEGSFIGGNNELALALVILVPLIFYLWKTASSRWIRLGLLAAMVFCGVAALGSHSRGALLAVGAMAFFLTAKTGKFFRSLLLTAFVAVLALSLMPEHWWSRMETIETFDEDASATARLHTWRMIWTLAMDRPIVGAGFGLGNPLLYQLYAENPLAKAHSAHSIYFQALGEHGFVGLALYLLLATATWRQATRLAKAAKGSADQEWVALLMRMVQVSMAGFAVGGAFLGLLHFDLPYYLAAIVVLVQRAVRTAPAPAIADKAADLTPALQGDLPR